MLQTINHPVCVITRCNQKTHRLEPFKFKWGRRIFTITKLGFYHHYKQGSQVFHVFEGVCDNLFFRLVLDSHSLIWNLEKISDGEVD